MVYTASAARHSIADAAQNNSTDTEQHVHVKLVDATWLCSMVMVQVEPNAREIIRISWHNMVSGMRGYQPVCRTLSSVQASQTCAEKESVLSVCQTGAL